MTKQATAIAGTLSQDEAQALYDDHAKRLLGCRMVLAAFVKQVIPELAGCSVQEVAALIEPDIQIFTKLLSPDLRIRGLNTEYREQGEKGKKSKGIRFDILFRLNLPQGVQRILINIEIQKDKPSGYQLVNRGLVYVSHEISSQTDREYVEGSYDDLLPVYSIWIVAGQQENTISTFELTEHTDGVPGKWGLPDKAHLVILGFNEKSGYVPGEPPVWNLLRSLFSTTMEVEEKLKILEGYGVPVTADVEEEVDDMCNLGQGVFEDGLQHGRQEGRMEGKQLGESEAVRKTGLLKEAMTKAGRFQEFIDALGSLKALNRLYAEFGIE